MTSILVFLTCSTGFPSNNRLNLGYWPLCPNTLHFDLEIFITTYALSNCSELKALYISSFLMSMLHWIIYFRNHYCFILYWEIIYGYRIWKRSRAATQRNLTLYFFAIRKATIEEHSLPPPGEVTLYPGQSSEFKLSIWAFQASDNDQGIKVVYLFL